MNTLSVIQEFLKDRLGLEHGRITPEARLEDLGIDSLMLLELLFEFEEKLGISLSNDMAMPETVGALLAIVEQHQALPQTAD